MLRDGTTCSEPGLHTPNISQDKLHNLPAGQSVRGTFFFGVPSSQMALVSSRQKPSQHSQSRELYAVMTGGKEVHGVVTGPQGGWGTCKDLTDEAKGRS